MNERPPARYRELRERGFGPSQLNTIIRKITHQAMEDKTYTQEDTKKREKECRNLLRPRLMIRSQVLSSLNAI